jgi:transcription-repair coupling factor (superfamily II helicase)
MQVQIKKKSTHNLKELSLTLVQMGYEKVSAISAPMEFSIRGGIFDVWVAERKNPCRVEFFDDTVDNIFFYDIITSDKIQALDFIIITERKKTAVKDKSVFYQPDWNENTFLVHESYGVGKYIGFKSIEQEPGIIRDFVEIKYAGNETLFVPITNLNLVSQYNMPNGTHKVKLDTLRGDRWKNKKAKVKSAVKDIAKKLLVLYAERETTKGFSFDPDDEMQFEFEAKFPYVETDDQLRAIREIKRDMERPHPMDRLLCGDVGFGKTEVALRAVFKCVSVGKQCVILAPTTVLAFQHYNTCLERFKDFPVEIRLLSRLVPLKEQRKIFAELEDGKANLVIGTHKLLQKSIKFHDLGLAIIDEEQRFGVEHKERFKELFKEVDVLTLSATPIPRTLNMALAGMRDMSRLENPPYGREPVDTLIFEYDEELVYEAIKKELDRGGQVYYIHNRIDSIYAVAERIKQVFPKKSVRVAHGRMHEKEMSEVWLGVVKGEVDILVCTTIIETGVDVPNVNTLIIENADDFGLSQLYQLRGRVGRASKKAYAYLTYKADKAVSEIAEQRLEAIREFTGLGSGYYIAMRDLEIRGAGDILGSSQSGHIATVGYEMFIKLLNKAIRELKGELPEVELECTIDIKLDFHISEEYIPNKRERLAIYHKVAKIETDDAKFALEKDITESYGEMPKGIRNLLDYALLRYKASLAGILEIKELDGKLYFYIQKLEMKAITGLQEKYKGRVRFNSLRKPYVMIRILKGEDIKGLIEDFILNLNKK